MMRDQYAVVVPVKPPTLGKSRLVGLPAERRRDLATAFALVRWRPPGRRQRRPRAGRHRRRAVRQAALPGPGCAAIPDGVAGDLNDGRLAAAEVAQALAGARAGAALLRGPAVPAARGSGRGAPNAFSDRPAFVADAAGIGTTMYAAPHGEFDPLPGRTHERRMSMRAPGSARRAGVLAATSTTWPICARRRPAGVGVHTAELAEGPETQ